MGQVRLPVWYGKEKVVALAMAMLVTLVNNSGFSQALPLSTVYEKINSPYDEQNPLLSPDGNTFYFTRGHHPENTGGTKDPGDIWYARLEDDGKWSLPQRLKGQVNDRRWNGVIGFSKDGNTMYLHQQYPSGKAAKGISLSLRNGEQWSTPVNVNIPYFSNKSKLQSACFSEDRTIIIFSLESYGSYGAEDLYISRLSKNGQWSEPKNLGRKINTRYQELTPYLGGDNRTLYFSSNGLGGQGSYDVFVSKRIDDTWTNWTKPKNLGERVNTRGRELYFSYEPQDHTAIYASTQDSDGYGDFKLMTMKDGDIEAPSIEPTAEEKELISVNTALYAPSEPTAEEEDDDKAELTVAMDRGFQVSAIEREFTLQGTVMNAQSQRAISAHILISNTAGEIWEMESADGNYAITLPRAGDYTVKATAPGYTSQMGKVGLSAEYHQQSKDFELSLLDVGESINLDHVQFKQGTTEILSGSHAQLDSFVKTMMDNPSLEVELGGHTDNLGSSRLNYKLSRERADKVKEYLVDKGISAKKITTKGYGGSKPIADNRNPITRKENRRVEFKVVKK